MSRFFLCFLLGACAPEFLPTPDEAPHGNDHASPDSTLVGADGGVGEPMCPPFSHPGDAGCTSTIAWSDQTKGPPARDHHLTFVVATDHGGTLYVTGGIDEPARSARNDLWSAMLSPSGEVSPWVRGPAPLVFQTGSALASVGARTYVLGGKTVVGGRIGFTTEVTSLEVSHTGLPLGWRRERPLPAPHFHASGHGFERWVYVIGGLNVSAGLATTEVLRAEVLADGDLGPWATVSTLPEPRTHHSSVIVGRRLFVFSGIDGSGIGFDPMDYRDGLVTTIDAEGNLGPWARFELPFASVAGSATVVGRAVYVVGGLENLVPTGTVWRAELRGDTLGPFSLSSALPFARAHVHHTPAWRQFIYSVGGNTGNHVAVDRVLRGVVE